MTVIKSSVQKAAAMLHEQIRGAPASVGLVLGSGLGGLADGLGNRQVLETASISDWPKSTVTGHSGRLVSGLLRSVPVIVLQGRVHYYEGYSMQQVTFPVRVLGELGVHMLIVTNAAGGLNPDYQPGDLMLITDHINLMGTNPLIGYFDPEAPTRFPDMSQPYDFELRDMSIGIADKLNIPLRTGVLAVTSGPSYETAAEVRMLQTLGGDAVCMSTVPEVIVAVQMGLRILGISCITNLATGLAGRPLSHSEVKDTAARIQDTFIMLISGIVEAIGNRMHGKRIRPGQS